LAAQGFGPDDMVAVVLPNRGGARRRTLRRLAFRGLRHTGPAEAGYQIQDSDAKVVVGDPGATQATTLDLAALRAGGAGMPAPAESAARSDGLTLVIYTGRQPHAGHLGRQQPGNRSTPS